MPNLSCFFCSVLCTYDNLDQGRIPLVLRGHETSAAEWNVNESCPPSPTSSSRQLGPHKTSQLLMTSSVHAST
ncbi:hypothetical protein TMatcc_007552 [Talaromyces marneffei ATCC 18224]